MISNRKKIELECLDKSMKTLETTRGDEKNQFEKEEGKCKERERSLVNGRGSQEEEVK